MRIVVVGLGPAGPGLVTADALAAIARIAHRYVRTTRHPSAGVVAPATAFDDVYDQVDRLDDVYATIVERLVDAAREHGEVLYAVPGSALVAERTVALLSHDTRVEVEIVPGVSYLDLAWAALRVDPVALGVRLVDGRNFAIEAAGERGPLLVAQCDGRQMLSDIKLSLDDVDGNDGPVVTVLQHLGLTDQTIFDVAWADLDRSFEPDHLTTLWIPALAVPVGAELVRFYELVRTLRVRCPWDREQSHQTLTRHLLEETYEVLEAIDALDLADATTYEHLADELGDLLFQIFFHSVLGSEAGQFTVADIARGIHDKLVRRHPHVFGSVEAETAAAVVTNWEQIKKVEKGTSSLMEGIAGNLPSLLYATKVQKKAASVGFDWADVSGAFPKVAEETAELAAVIESGDAKAIADELGDLLFAVTNVARHVRVDPEAALRAATAKFRERFADVERLAAGRGLELTELDLSELDGLWGEVKTAHR
jgi:tetrapyrrole methylase family protein / MazG family protein